MTLLAGITSTHWCNRLQNEAKKRPQATSLSTSGGADRASRFAHSDRDGRPPDALEKTPSQPAALRDYFFYVCVHQYYRGQTLDTTDVSNGYIFELSYDTKTLMAVLTAAKNVADSIHRRQKPGLEVAEGDYRKATVLATCLEASRSFKITPR